MQSDELRSPENVTADARNGDTAILWQFSIALK